MYIMQHICFVEYKTILLVWKHVKPLTIILIVICLDIILSLFNSKQYLNMRNIRIAISQQQQYVLYIWYKSLQVKPLRVWWKSKLKWRDCSRTSVSRYDYNMCRVGIYY